MAKEIERKFLVKSDTWKKNTLLKKVNIKQGYLAKNKGQQVRVRVEDNKATLTIKGKAKGIARDEFEYEIPRVDGEAMLAGLCSGAIVEKIRHEVPHGAHVWEVDVFEGANRGLVVAEVELADEDESFLRPEWLGEEVSGDARYYNVSLARHPYGDWSGAGGAHEGA